MICGFVSLKFPLVAPSHVSHAILYSLPLAVDHANRWNRRDACITTHATILCPFLLCFFWLNLIAQVGCKDMDLDCPSKT